MLWPQRPSHNGRTQKIGRLFLWCALSVAANGQTNGALPALPATVPGGQGEIAFQGYYLGGSQQDLLNTTGTAFHFQEFLPTIGFLSGSLEGYGSQNRFQTGENFLQLRGLPWAGYYWTVAGGDFRTPATVVEFPFNNIYTPEIDGRGVKVQAIHGATQYTFFAGQETLSAGARVAYRILSPQMLMGVSAVHKIAPHLLVGARLMQFSADPQSIADNPTLFPAGQTAALIRTMSVQSLYTPVKRLKVYGEASRPQTGAEHKLTSVLAGFTWEGPVFTLKANYVYQGLFYFPLAGYFAGDRRGPYGEVHFRPWKGLELFASASQYRNNLERDPSLPSMTSNGTSAGISALLPAKLSLTGQVSTVGVSDQTPGEADTLSNNRQISASLARNFGRQTVQITWRDILMSTGSGPERQRSSEAGDMLQLRRFSVGGTVRYQQVTGTETLNSLFFRGTAQVNVGPLSAYANVELGNDLANQTIFSTEAYRTSVVGVSLRLPGRWNLQTEMFRNQLNLTLSPENIFLLQNGDALAGLSPAAATLSATSQWSLFFRLSKQLHWGGGLPQESPVSSLTSGGVLSLTGGIEGVVRLKTLAGPLDGPAVSIPVSLDNSRSAVSGPDGHYVFANVPEGAHEVSLALAELPADFDPGELAKSSVVVQPRRTARADFDVLPLAEIAGRVTGPEKAELENIIIRLLPGKRYTSTDKEGAFKFYNVREGDFSVALDAQTLPEDGELQSPAKVPVAIRIGTPTPSIQFSFLVKTTQKPIRKVLDRK
ncbi:MAG TPA: hypothetical protein VLW65_22195 [Bryobacteraceae bacterium]|nr:hypothetical protein [Bryobacteraceae bacterium]